MVEHNRRLPWVNHKLVAHNKVPRLSHALRSHRVVVRGQNTAAREIAAAVQLDHMAGD